jgi:hypothetical protein
LRSKYNKPGRLVKKPSFSTNFKTGMSLTLNKF